MKVFTGEEGDRETQRQKDRDIHTPAADSHCYISSTYKDKKGTLYRVVKHCAPLK